LEIRTSRKHETLDFLPLGERGKGPVVLISEHITDGPRSILAIKNFDTSPTITVANAMAPPTVRQ
jgi:hypothetical protein